MCKRINTYNLTHNVHKMFSTSMSYIYYGKEYNDNEIIIIILLIPVFHTSIELACPKMHVNQYSRIYMQLLEHIHACINVRVQL